MSSFMINQFNWLILRVQSVLQSQVHLMQPPGVLLHQVGLTERGGGELAGRLGLVDEVSNVMEAELRGCLSGLFQGVRDGLQGVCFFKALEMKEIVNIIVY